jgi:hypothetical protein
MTGTFWISAGYGSLARAPRPFRAAEIQNVPYTRAASVR